MQCSVITARKRHLHLHGAEGITRPDGASQAKDMQVLIFFFLNFIYLFMRDIEREVETQAEGKAGSMQEA